MIVEERICMSSAARHLLKGDAVRGRFLAALAMT
jgi:hypothetical protein